MRIARLALAIVTTSVLVPSAFAKSSHRTRVHSEAKIHAPAKVSRTKAIHTAKAVKACGVEKVKTVKHGKKTVPEA